jgi:hypothetical protein
MDPGVRGMRIPRTAPLLALLLPMVAGPLAAQDFLFGRPSATVVVYGGWSSPSESGDLFSFTRDQLTVERGDFSAPSTGWRWRSG